MRWFFVLLLSLFIIIVIRSENTSDEIRINHKNLSGDIKNGRIFQKNAPFSEKEGKNEKEKECLMAVDDFLDNIDKTTDNKDFLENSRSQVKLSLVLIYLLMDHRDF